MTREKIKTDDSSFQVSFEKIKSEISQRSVGLKEIDLITKFYSKWYRILIRISNCFIQLHKNLSRHKIYMKTVGALFLFLRGRKSDFRIVRFSDYLILQDEAFIVALYKDVLKREVDLQSFSSMMAALQSSVDSRIDIGYDLNLSNEASLTKVYIQGVYFEKVLLDTKRAFHRWFSKPVTFLIKVKNRLRRIVRGSKI